MQHICHEFCISFTMPQTSVLLYTIFSSATKANERTHAANNTWSFISLISLASICFLSTQKSLWLPRALQKFTCVHATTGVVWLDVSYCLATLWSGELLLNHSKNQKCRADSEPAQNMQRPQRLSTAAPYLPLQLLPSIKCASRKAYSIKQVVWHWRTPLTSTPVQEGGPQNLGISRR